LLSVRRHEVTRGSTQTKLHKTNGISEQKAVPALAWCLSSYILIPNIYTMKNKVKLLGAVVIATLMFAVACSKDDDPADNDFFVGTYHGSITYNGDGKTITDDDGRVTVVKVDDSYSFDFGSDIPNITGVKFQKKDDNTYVSIGEGVTGITVTASSLKMLVSNDNGTWTADCSR